MFGSYYNETHSYEVDYRLLSRISSHRPKYEIFMELFLSRQNDQIAPVLDTSGWCCSVTPLSQNGRSRQEYLKISKQCQYVDILSTTTGLAYLKISKQWQCIDLQFAASRPSPPPKTSNSPWVPHCRKL